MAMGDAGDHARSLLNGIDSTASIGGPLPAAIAAQEMAARSTAEFIKEVGLQTKDGVTSAVNVTFQYRKNGETVQLSVPLLTIVPIPLIAVDELEIESKELLEAVGSQAAANLASGETPSAQAGWTSGCAGDGVARIAQSNGMPSPADGHGRPTPGFTCVRCGAMITFTLSDFLHSDSIACLGCGQEFYFDKSQCSGVLEQIRQLQE